MDDIRLLSHYNWDEPSPIIGGEGEITVVLKCRISRRFNHRFQCWDEYKDYWAEAILPAADFGWLRKTCWITPQEFANPAEHKEEILKRLHLEGEQVIFEKIIFEV